MSWALVYFAEAPLSMREESNLPQHETWPAGRWFVTLTDRRMAPWQHTGPATDC